MMKHVLLISALLFCLPAHAEWSKQYDFAYTMGDGDTKGSARQSAVEQIKLRASNESGTYVDSTTTLKEDGSLTESIQMISTSMVMVRIDKESMSISQSGQTILNLVATATLDDAELAKRVDVLRQDKEKARQMKVLQVENEMLRAGLDKIRASLANKSDPAVAAELLAKQDQTIRKLEANNATVTQVFSQGTLLQFALKNKDALEEAKQDLDEELYAHILKTKIRTDIEAVEQNDNGYTALVRVEWDLDLNKTFKVLSGFLGTEKYESPRGKSDPHFEIAGYHNKDGKGLNSLSPKIFDYIANRPVFAKVSIGGKDRFLPVLYGGYGFMDKCKNTISLTGSGTKEADAICVTNLRKSDTTMAGMRYANPVRVSLSKTEAEQATNVTAEMIIHDKQSQEMISAKLSEEYKKEQFLRKHGYR